MPQRRYWPFLLTLMCWALVLLVPVTRQGIFPAWDNWQSFLAHSWGGIEILPLSEVSRATGSNNRASYQAYLVTVKIHEAIVGLYPGRYNGPLSNPKYPAPPPETDNNTVSSRSRWNKLMALAQQGQKLEPENSYFDWILLYGLYATHQDDAARRALNRAARKTAYNSHARDAIFNSIEIWKRDYHSPLTPAQLGVSNLKENELANIARHVADWTMDLVLTDRLHKQHQRALDTAFDFMKLGRLLRREGYSRLDSSIGRTCEVLALRRSGIASPLLKPVRSNASLIAFQNSPLSLYFYAKTQHRNDIMRATRAEWLNMADWRKAAYYRYDWMATYFGEAVMITGANHLRTLILNTLPATLFLIALLWCQSRRFPTERTEPVWTEPMRRRGAWAGSVLLFCALGCSALLAWGDGYPLSLIDSNIVGIAPSWITLGLPATLCSLAAHQAFSWQRNQLGNQAELSNGEASHFDFGWILKTAARLAFWCLLLGGTFGFCYASKSVEANLGTTESPLAIWFFQLRLVLAFCFMVVLLLSWWGINLFAWNKRAQRGPTYRKFLRLAQETLTGYLVTSSLLYAVLAFGALGPSVHFQHTFEALVQKGELQTMRARLGLK